MWPHSHRDLRCRAFLSNGPLVFFCSGEWAFSVGIITGPSKYSSE